MNFRTQAVERLARPTKLNEAQAPPFPHDWKAGFRGHNEYVIGGGGKEEPYLKNNEWVLYVYNKKTGKHELYNYSTDMFELDESVIAESALPADIKAKLLMAVTAYDRRRENKPGYNIYALPQYVQGLQSIERKVAAGDTLRVAITSSFIDRLQDACLKAVGEPKGTSDEVRGWGPRSKLRESVEGDIWKGILAKMDCPQCHGKGYNSAGTQKCPNCRGSGEVQRPPKMNPIDRIKAARLHEAPTHDETVKRLLDYYFDLVKRVGLRTAQYGDDLIYAYEKGRSLNTVKPWEGIPRDQAKTIRSEVEHIITLSCDPASL